MHVITSSNDEKVACKKILEKKGLKGFQVIDGVILLLETFDKSSSTLLSNLFQASIIVLLPRPMLIPAWSKPCTDGYYISLYIRNAH